MQILLKFRLTLSLGFSERLIALPFHTYQTFKCGLRVSSALCLVPNI